MHDLEGFLVGNDGYYGAGIMSTFIGNHDVPRVIHFAQDWPLWHDVWTNGKDKAWWDKPGLPAETAAFERVANAFTLLFTLPGVPLVYYGDEIGLPGAGDPDNRRFMQWSGYNAAQLELRNHVATLAQIRAQHPALRRGSRTTLAVGNDTLAYRMQTGGDEVFVVINRGDGGATVGGLPAGSYADQLDGSTHSGPDISLPARSARVLTLP
jgi:glycosidase